MSPPPSLPHRGEEFQSMPLPRKGIAVFSVNYLIKPPFPIIPTKRGRLKFSQSRFTPNKSDRTERLL